MRIINLGKQEAGLHLPSTTADEIEVSLKNGWNLNGNGGNLNCKN